MAAYFDRGGGQISIDGPPVALKPEAAQNLGLALHEMAVNAAKYGALSVPLGALGDRLGAGVRQQAIDWNGESNSVRR